MMSDLLLFKEMIESPIDPSRQEVNGCEGLISCAQSHTFLRNVYDFSPMPNCPGSLYKSHINILSSSLYNSRSSWV